MSNKLRIKLKQIQNKSSYIETTSATEESRIPKESTTGQPKFTRAPQILTDLQYK